MLCHQHSDAVASQSAIILLAVRACLGNRWAALLSCSKQITAGVSCACSRMHLTASSLHRMATDPYMTVCLLVAHVKIAGMQVDAWMAVQPPLDARRLLPALLRWGEEGAPATARSHALRYVQFCLQRLGSTDAAVHNLAVRNALFHPLLGACMRWGCPLLCPDS